MRRDEAVNYAQCNRLDVEIVYKVRHYRDDRVHYEYDPHHRVFGAALMHERCDKVRAAGGGVSLQGQHDADAHKEAAEHRAEQNIVENWRQREVFQE